MVQKIKKYRKGLSHFIASENGQRFFNFAYSIGAAIVIWGALFKILHLPGGNTLLSIGMGTEVLMFILTAFDRPPKEYKWEEVFPVLSSKNPEDRPEFTGNGALQATVTSTPQASQAYAGNSPKTADASAQYLGTTPELAAEMAHLTDTTRELNRVHDLLLESYRSITDNSAGISQSSNGYVEQMQNLNRNIAAINTIYEIQLKSISGQLDSIDRVNRGISGIRDMFERSAAQSARYCEEAEKMARYMQQLNSVYEKMITAMTINMYRPMPPMDIPQQETPSQAAPQQ